METPLVQGVPISAGDLERIVSQWADRPHRFHSLMNTVISASLDSPAEDLNLTERVGRDDGWDADVKASATWNDPFGIIGPGRTAYQFKSHDTTARSRKEIIGEIQRELPKELESLLDRAGQSENPDRYVLLTNVDFNRNESKKLEDALHRVATKQNCKLDIRLVGASGLASRLNDLPHIRSAYFATDAFASIETVREELEHHARRMGLVWTDEIVGRRPVTSELESLLRDPEVRIINLSGRPGVGKTRTAVEVLRSDAWRGNVVVAARPEVLQPGPLRGLMPPKNEVILFVDLPLDAEEAHALVQTVLGIPRLRLVLESHEPIEGYPSGRTIRMDPLDAGASMDLLDRAIPGSDWSLKMWLRERTSGLPGFILSAAGLAPEIRENDIDLEKRVGEGFWKRTSPRLSIKERKAAEALALLRVVRCGSGSIDLPILAEVFGIEVRDLETAIPVLEREGVLIARPSAESPRTARIVPPLLAGALARKAIKSINVPAGLQQEALMARLDGVGRGQLLARMADVRDEGERLVESLLYSETGPCPGFRSLVSYAPRLREFSGPFPASVAPLLKRITEASPEERRCLSASERSDLVATARNLLFNEKTHGTGLLVLISLLETGRPGEDSGGFLRPVVEALEAFHPQISERHEKRLETLKMLWHEKQDPETERARLILVRAAASAFEPGVYYGHSTGATPPEAPPPATWDEILCYAEGLVELLDNGTRDSAENVASAARSGLGRLAVSLLADRAEPLSKPAIRALHRVEQWAGLLPRDEIAGWVNSIDRWVELLRKAERADEPPEFRWLFKLRRDLDGICENLMSGDGSFLARLKRSFGQWSHRQWEAIAPPNTLPQGEVRKDAAGLAKEALGTGLPDETMAWLTGSEACYASVFFEELGKLDTAHRFLSQIVKGGSRERGPAALAAYISSWPEAEEDAFLDRAVQDESVSPRAVLEASLRRVPAARSIRRLVSLVDRRRIKPTEVVAMIPFSVARKSVDPDALAEGLEVLGQVQEPWGAMAGVRLVSFLLRGGFQPSPALTDKVVALLERASSESSNHWIEWGQVALEVLGSRPVDVARIALALVENKPDWREYPHEMFEVIGTLGEPEREQLFREAFDRARSTAGHPSRYTDLVRAVVSPARDRQLLLKIGRGSPDDACQVVESLRRTPANAFWLIAGELLTQFPESKELAGRVRSVLFSTEGWVAEACEELLRRAEAAQAYATDGRTPAQAARFAKNVALELSESAGRGIVWDHDLDLDDLQMMARSETESERVWAAGRILRYAPPVEALKLLSLEQVRDALPSVGHLLPEKTLRTYRSALEHWLPNG